MVIREITSPLEARELRKQFRATGDKHPVLNEFELQVYRGSYGTVLLHEDAPVSVNVSHIGKRKKNIFEPYLNWYIAYTLPEFRRHGFATALYRAVEEKAQGNGCRRIKSLAGSVSGALLHLSLDHLIWGTTEKKELIVDSPLPASISVYTKRQKPPTALTDIPLTKTLVKQLLKDGLRYDKL